METKIFYGYKITIDDLYKLFEKQYGGTEKYYSSGGDFFDYFNENYNGIPFEHYVIDGFYYIGKTLYDSDKSYETDFYTEHGLFKPQELNFENLPEFDFPLKMKENKKIFIFSF